MAAYVTDTNKFTQQTYRKEKQTVQLPKYLAAGWLAEIKILTQCWPLSASALHSSSRTAQSNLSAHHNYTQYDCKGKEKERKSIYIAPFCTKVHTKCSGMDHTVLPANNTMPAFPLWHSPDVTTTATEAAHIQLQLTTHLPTPKGWKAELA